MASPLKAFTSRTGKAYSDLSFLGDVATQEFVDGLGFDEDKPKKKERKRGHGLSDSFEIT